MARFPRVKFPNLKDPLSRRRFIILSLMAAAVLVVFSIGMLGATGTPRSCNLFCHSMDPNYNTWKKSAHANVPCVSCHSAPGGAFTKIVEDITVNIPAGAKEFIGFEKPINRESKISQEQMEPERCFRCHNIKTRNFTPREGMLMTSRAHQKHLKKGLLCTTCHNRVTHQASEKQEPLKTWVKEKKEKTGEEFKYKNFLTMTEGCFRCHSRKQPRLEDLTEELKKVAKKTPRECTTCHPADWKLLPAGHGKAWRSEHKQLASQNFNYCFNCHEEGKRFTFEGKIWCLACHDDEAIARYRQAAKGQPI